MGKNQDSLQGAVPVHISCPLQSHTYFTRFHTYLENFTQFCFLNIDTDGLESNKEIMKQKLCFLKIDTEGLESNEEIMKQKQAASYLFFK
jgi:hypothetical protein